MKNEQEIPKYEVKPLEPLALPESCESGPKGLVVNGEEVPFVAVPSVQQLPAAYVPKEYPVITDAERLAVRDSQFQRTQTREQANVAVRNADQALTRKRSGKKSEGTTVAPVSTSAAMISSSMASQ